MFCHCFYRLLIMVKLAPLTDPCHSFQLLWDFIIYLWYSTILIGMSERTSPFFSLCNTLCYIYIYFNSQQFTIQLHMLGIWIDIRSYCIDLVCFLLIFSVLGIRSKPRALYELENCCVTMYLQTPFPAHFWPPLYILIFFSCVGT